MNPKLELKFAVNFPYKGGGGIWSRFAESAIAFLQPQDYVLINASSLISRKGDFTPIFKKTIDEELREKYGRFPSVKIIVDFGSAFREYVDGVESDGSDRSLDSVIQRAALGYQQLSQVWKPALYTSIDVPTVQPPHIKIKGGERRPLFNTVNDRMNVNYRILESYKSLLRDSHLAPGRLLISIQGHPKLPETYASAFQKFGFSGGIAGFSMGSLTETKISTSYNQETIEKRLQEFFDTCLTVRKCLENIEIVDGSFHLHFMGCGSYTKLPLIAYVFSEFPQLIITADLQTPVKRAADNEYLELKKGRYDAATNDHLSARCECEMCRTINDSRFGGSISSFLASNEGKELISEKSSEEVRRKTVLIWHNILVHRRLAKMLSGKKTSDEVLDSTRETSEPRLFSRIENIVTRKTLI